MSFQVNQGWALKVDEGWEITSNSKVIDQYSEDLDFFEYEVGNDEGCEYSLNLFAANNMKKGQQLFVRFLKKTREFALVHRVNSRQNGIFDSWYIEDDENENSHLRSFDKEILRSNNIDEILQEIQQFLNPLNKDLIAFKPALEWCFHYNNLTYSSDGYNDIELLFFTSFRRYFVEVMYYKNISLPYMLTIGMANQQIQPGVYEINEQKLRFTITKYFDDPLVVATFIEEFTDDYENQLKVLSGGSAGKLK